ncbi:MAG TPA: SPFH domain-containing protein [Chitinophagales bacterium]|nr:SPFH domain-containing protein [Chitinophagales bacterium]HNM32945.1 SPFH domain-containing protein [Chitinophagales bacterium]
MGILDTFRNEFIDIIEWTDNTQDTLVWKFPRFQNEIKTGAQLTVRESQVAVFLNEGKLADVYLPGRYELTTANMPILTTLKGWKYGFNSPFKVDIYYVNTKQFTDQKWGTKNPITLNDPRFGMIEIRAFGNFSFRVSDAGRFMKEIVGTDREFTTDEITGQLRTMIVQKLTESIADSKLKIEEYASNLDAFSKFASEKLADDFDSYGLKVTSVLVENISMPDEVKKEIFELSRLDKIDMQKLTQWKTAQGIEKAAESGGMAGAFVGVGAGSIINNAMNASQQPSATPPPMMQLFVAVNGAQTGPFDVPVLTQMAQSGQLKGDTLVWKAGMAAWAAAATVPELAAILGAVPPPIAPPPL